MTTVLTPWVTPAICLLQTRVRRPTCRMFASLLAALAILCVVPPARSQAYPGKQPIRLVVPFAPGTGSDLLARLLTPRLTELLGQNVIVDNRPGGGSIVATEAVAKAAPDGYTLLLGTNAQFVIGPAVYGNKLRYRPDTDFVALGSVARTPMVLVTSMSDSAPKNLAEFIQRVRAAPANFSSTGSGAFGHLVGELLVYRLGAKATHIPYRGSAQSLTDVSTGEILFAMDSPAAAASLLRASKLRALAITGTERSGSMRDVPTLEEAGVKGMNVFAWFGVFGPAGLPAEVTQRLRNEVARTVRESELHQRLSTLSLEPYMTTPEQFERTMRDDLPFWQKFVQDAAIQISQ